MFVFCRVLLTWHRLLHLTLSILRKWSLWKWRKQALLRNNQQQRKENSFFQINHFLAVGNRSSRESDKELSQRIMKNNYEVKFITFTVVCTCLKADVCEAVLKLWHTEYLDGKVITSAQTPELQRYHKAKAVPFVSYEQAARPLPLVKMKGMAIFFHGNLIKL